MDRIAITGGARLAGEIPISGAKNSAIKLMAASLLTEDALRLTNMPRLADTRFLGRLLQRLGTEVVGGRAGEDGWLQSLVLRSAEGEAETVPSDGLFLMIGADPNTGWLPGQCALGGGGFVRTGAEAEAPGDWPLERSPLLLETSMPGVFAAGDVRHGSMNRVASAVGEGSIAIRLVHELVAAEESQPRDLV